MEDDRHRDSSLKQKLKSSICLYWCFRSSPREESVETDERPRLIRSSSWIRSKVHEIPDLKEKYRNMISRMGMSRRHSSDFRYDPLSYSLNFDEGEDESQVDDFRYRNFSARLSASSRQDPSPPVVSREITCS
ncbi:uncharacterized protein LOC143878161 [Tasmannia lanceolata]|uniref:uncharacterized protein LOC143878161 n=1 Tax=Tasmannia lanceolata TaxID=3420 RepID=UPI004063A7BB